MHNGRIKAGKNIILKNNFKSLIETETDSGKRKVDHQQGTVVYSDHGEWDSSQMGMNAKDVSDAVVGSAFTLISELDNHIPRYQWSDRGQKEHDPDLTREEILDRIHKKYQMVAR